MFNYGKECLDRVRKGEIFDIIFTLEDLSKIDAHELLRKLKLEQGFNTKVILISDVEDPNKITSYMDEGFYKVLNINLVKNDIVELINKRN